MKFKYLILPFIIGGTLIVKSKYIKILLIILLGWLINIFDPIFSNDNKHLSFKSNNILEELSIIVPSCDKYNELWEPHFQSLFDKWPNLNSKLSFVPIYVVSNFKEFTHQRVINIKVGEDKSWSDNLIHALPAIKTKYVLILLDDYIFDESVNEARLIQIMNFMENNNAAYIELVLDSPIANDVDYVKYGMGIKKRFAESRTSLQASLWNVNTLKELLEPNETAWDFEVLGSIRSRLMKEQFYLVIKEPVFHYLNAVNKGKYRQSVIDYINGQGIKFNPVSLEIDKQL